MDDLKYIEKNYIEWNDLCHEFNISSEKLVQLISSNRLPKPSYEIIHNYKISSALNDSKENTVIKKYFPKSIIKLINKDKEGKTKEEFRSALYKSLESNKHKSYVYNEIVDNKGNINNDVFNKYCDERWAFYMKGVYGICTNNMTEEEIVRKGIVVERLQEFQKKNTSELRIEKEVLVELNNEYNEVATLFSPFQREKSSRGKYLDQSLKKNNLNNLVKKYDI
jgi:hypothetical protein